MYSTYALNENVIKKEERKLLKEIVPFVQTALIRLYIEEGDEGRDKIYDFFSADIAARKPPTTIACRQYIRDSSSDLDWIKVKAVVNSRIQG